MKLLFDQNLSPRLVANLADLFPSSAHVEVVGLGKEIDRLVWNMRRKTNTSSFLKMPILVNSDHFWVSRQRLFGYERAIVRPN